MVVGDAAKRHRTNMNLKYFHAILASVIFLGSLSPGVNSKFMYHPLKDPCINMTVDTPTRHSRSIKVSRQLDIATNFLINNSSVELENIYAETTRRIDLLPLRSNMVNLRSLLRKIRRKDKKWDKWQIFEYGVNEFYEDLDVLNKFKIESNGPFPHSERSEILQNAMGHIRLLSCEIREDLKTKNISQKKFDLDKRQPILNKLSLGKHDVTTGVPNDMAILKNLKLYLVCGKVLLKQKSKKKLKPVKPEVCKRLTKNCTTFYNNIKKIPKNKKKKICECIMQKSDVRSL